MNAHSHRARNGSSREDVLLSVAALLRREGRGPHAADGRLRPRRCYRITLDTQPHPMQSFRKATAATCALFAASALFGTSVLDNAVTTPQAGADVPHQRGGTAIGARGRPASAATGRVPSGTDPALTLMASNSDIPAGAIPSQRQRGSKPPAAATADVAPVVDVPRQRQATSRGWSVAMGDIPFVNSPSGGSPPGGVPSGVDTPDADGPGVTVPDVPAVTVPDVPAGGSVTTPDVAVTPGGIDPPDVSVSTERGTVAASTSDAAVSTPDIEVAGATAGPVSASPAKVTTPDVSLSGGRVAVGAEPEVELPKVSASRTKIETPDVEVAGATVELPDADLPEVTVDANRPVEAVVDTAEKVRSDAMDDTSATVSGLLGKVDGDERSKQDESAGSSSENVDSADATKGSDEPQQSRKRPS